MPELLLAVSVPVVITSFSVYTLAIVAIGLYAARYSTKSDEDYFLAGRSLSGPVAALSASASSESGWVTLGLVGFGYGSGVQGYWVIPGCLLGYIFNWFILAGRMSDQARALNALTLPDFLCFRFRERTPWIRTVAVLVILAAMMAYVAAQMAAAGKAFGVLFDEMRSDSTAAMVASQPVNATDTVTTAATNGSQPARLSHRRSSRRGHRAALHRHRRLSSRVLDRLSSSRADGRSAGGVSDLPLVDARRIRIHHIAIGAARRMPTSSTPGPGRPDSHSSVSSLEAVRWASTSAIPASRTYWCASWRWRIARTPRLAGVMAGRVGTAGVLGAVTNRPVRARDARVGRNR